MKKTASVLFGIAVAFSVILSVNAESYECDVKVKYASYTDSGTVCQKNSDFQTVIESITEDDEQPYKYVLSLLHDKQDVIGIYHVAFYDKYGSKIVPEENYALKLPFEYNGENVKLYFTDADGEISETNFSVSNGIAEVQTNKGGYYVFANTAEIKDEDNSSVPESDDKSSVPEKSPSKNNSYKSDTAVNISPNTGYVGGLSISLIAAAAAISVVKRKTDKK